MSRIFLLVGIGGFLGSAARYYSQQFLAKSIPSVLPYGTLAVNIIGCFLIGIIYGLSSRGNVLSPDWRIFLATGFCGGFTTFSAFSYESISLMQDGEYLYLSIYIAASVLFGLAATYLGILLIKSI
ncbi:MAG: fluoride efflux transporter CrcB [Bacteroidetes bacterium]|nr:fluoride efflux transporter CrcB [Bacteroidota bacterium]